MNPDDEKLVDVFRASSEMEALAIQAMLEDSGIPAAVRSRQIPMFDGIAKVYNPVWGFVVVLDDREVEARALITEYLKVLGEVDSQPVEDDQ